MDDLISRQAAIYAECEVCQIAPKRERGHNCIYYVNGCKEIECLRALPSAERRGRWIYNQNFAEPPFKCSSCGTAQGRLSRYCPDCGAKMERE